MSERDGRCDRCGNSLPVYPRTSRASAWSTIDSWLCKHCVDLEATDPDTWTGRYTDGKRGRQPITNPRSQPAPASMHGEMMRPCVYCQGRAGPKYAWRGGFVTACGWAHAGLWMDQQIELEELQREEADGLDYVKRSLGIN